MRVRQVSIGSATVTYDPSVTTLDEIIDAVNDEGYAAARSAGAAA